LKVEGLVTRVWGGSPWRARGLPPLSKDPKIRKAQRIIEAELEMARTRKKKQSALTPAPKPWAELTRGEKLERAADAGLDRAWEILALGVNPLNRKILAIVQNTALTVISRQIQIEAAQADRSHPVPTGLSRTEAIALMNAADKLDALLTLPADEVEAGDGSS
jgi:hypothetical protein